MTVLNEITAKTRPSVSQNPDQLLMETRSLGRLSVFQDSDPLKEGKCLTYTGSAPSTHQRINLNSGPKTVPGGLTTVLNTTTQKRSSLKSHTTSSIPLINKSDIIPVIVPRTSMRSEPVADSRKEVGIAGRTMPFPLQSKAADMSKFPNNRDDVDKPFPPPPPPLPVTESAASKGSELSGFADKNNFPASVSEVSCYDWREGSEQYKFIEHCLATVDRQKQPWLIFAAHCVLEYSSNYYCGLESSFEEPMGRKSLQRLWQKYKVDIAFYGHVHNYERTCPIYQENVKCRNGVQLFSANSSKITIAQKEVTYIRKETIMIYSSKICHTSFTISSPKVDVTAPPLKINRDHGSSGPPNNFSWTGGSNRKGSRWELGKRVYSK
ncbi:inactive purple acid phosphatase 27 [Spatholobus suberectus]|nr:inactive purple acid phosphatase 27 [Spatholobus suberectus]